MIHFQKVFNTIQYTTINEPNVINMCVLNMLPLVTLKMFHGFSLIVQFSIRDKKNVIKYTPTSKH